MTWENLKDQSGRLGINLVRIYFPVCARQFGTLPCEAVLDPQRGRCYNTTRTCQSPDLAGFQLTGVGVNRPSNFLEFATRRIDGRQANYLPASASDEGRAPVFPTLRDVSTAPTKLLPGDALAERGVLSFRIQDNLWTDVGLDPYPSDRAAINFLQDRGTMWQRLIARYYTFEGLRVELFTGFLTEDGEFLSENMTKRTYYITEMKGPDNNGILTFKAKDPLFRVATQKATCPVESFGKLLINILEDPAQDPNYDPGTQEQSIFLEDLTLPDGRNVYEEYEDALLAGQRYIAIDQEIFQMVSVDVLFKEIKAKRATLPDFYLGSNELGAHDVSAPVQICQLYYDENTQSQIRIDDVVYDLLVNFSGIDPDFINFPEWQAEVNVWLPNMTFARLIVQPVEVDQLLDEISQHGLDIWWQDRGFGTADDEKPRIRIQALQPPLPGIAVLDEDSNLIRDSLSITEQPKKRISRVWTLTTLKEPFLDDDKLASFGEVPILAKPKFEDEVGFGSPAIKRITSLWVQQNLLAIQTMQSRYLELYEFGAKKYTFQLDVKDSTFWTGDFIELMIDDVRDANGNMIPQRARIISARETFNQGTAKYIYEAEANSFASDSGTPERLGLIAPESVPEYTQATAEQQARYAFMTDDNGEYTNGDPGSVIA